MLFKSNIIIPTFIILSFPFSCQPHTHSSTQEGKVDKPDLSPFHTLNFVVLECQKQHHMKPTNVSVHQEAP